jgi:methylglutaconyl-CoA hydratase
MMMRRWLSSSSTTTTAASAVQFTVDSERFAYLTLNRPEVSNAFNNKTVKTIADHLQEVKAKSSSIRAVFIQSTGKFFSAGGDLNYMKEMAESLSGMLNLLSNLPVPTVALIQGPAFGGGVGLISCCDVALSVKTATFALSEVKLGLLPATISPYVISKIGESHARRFFITAETFNAEKAQSVGLVHEVFASMEELDAFATKLKGLLKNNSPTGIQASKELIQAVKNKPIDHSLMRDTAERLANQRSSPEGKEGVRAFLEKRKPKWTE